MIKNNFAVLSISVLISIIGLISCGSEKNKQLETAQELIEEHPDSALILLEELNLPNNSSDEDKATYGLLLTQARYKNYIDEINDSLIRSSSEYFISTENIEKACMSLFLLGIIQKNTERFGEAAVSMTKGLDLSREHGIYKLEGLCARGLFKIYCQLFDGSKQIIYAIEAYDAFMKADCKDWANYALLDIATAFNNNGQYNRSILEARHLKRQAEETKDTILLAESLRLMGLSQFAMGKSSESIISYATASSLEPMVLTKNDKHNILIAMAETRRDSLPKNILDIIEKTDINDKYDTPFELLANEGRYEEAYKSLENYKIEQDKILTTLLRNNVSGTLYNYEESKMQLQQEEAKNERLFWCLIVLILSIISISITFILKKKLLARKLQQETTIKNAEYLRTDLLHQIETNKLISDSLRDLFKQKYAIVNTLCTAYYESKGIKLEEKRIVHEVERMVRVFTNDNNQLKSLEEHANRYTDGVFSSFKEDFPKLKEDDHRLFLYLLMGFSACSISLFLNEKIEVIYNRKSRLKSKIRNSTTNRKEEYLSFVA